MGPRLDHSQKTELILSARDKGKLSRISSLRVGDIAEFPEVVKGVFDQVLVPIAVFVSADETLTVEAVKKDRGGANLIPRSKKLVRVVFFVAERRAHLATLFEHDKCGFHVAKTVARQIPRIRRPKTSVSARTLVVHPLRERQIA